MISEKGFVLENGTELPFLGFGTWLVKEEKIILDAGHGGDEPGAIYNGRKEKDDTLRLTLAVGRILEENGVSTLYTRTTDVYNSPQEKAEIANRSGADLFISIHRNAMPVPGTGRGASVLVYEDSGIAAVLAENILKNLVQLGFKDQGIVERPGLVVLRKTRMPAVLVEVGFIDNPVDNAFFDRNFDAIAKAIADGILNTLREQKEQFPLYYQVQTGAFRDRAKAIRLAKELQSAGFPVFIVYDEGLYKVRVGAFSEMENGIRMEQNVKQAGYPAYLVREAAIY